jgi:exonuclease SbcC
MRPICLEIEGLRSFRARQVIDFTGRDYIAVIGDTGAGKSSILEAITFALYGCTTFSGQGHQELVNASSTALRVVFVFDVRGEHWEVTRTLKRSGRGDIKPGITSLRRLDVDGSPLESFEKSRPVTAKVESILGLDDAAFLRTVVLPQGQFSRLLVDDDQTLRSGVLRQIWRTDELTEAGALASDALAELGPLRGRLAQALEGEPDDPDGHLDALVAEVGRCTTLLDLARQRQSEASTAADAVAAAAARVARIDQLISMLSKWDGSTAATAASKIEAADRQSVEHIIDTKQLLAVARAALDGVPTDDDGHTLTEIATYCTLLESLPALAAQRDGATTEATRTQQELDALEEQLARVNERAVKAAKEIDSLKADRTALADAATTAKAKLGPAQTALEGARSAASRADNADLLLQEAEAAIAELGPKLARACGARSQAKSSHEAATKALEEARRAAAAADAGHGLHGGDPCPVCDRELPPAWKPLAVPELDAARQALVEAAQDLGDTQASVIRHEGLFQAAETSVTDRHQDLAEARERATAAHGALGHHVGAVPDLERLDDELLADLGSTISVAISALDAHDTLIERAQAAHLILGNDHAASEAARQAKFAERGGAIGRRDQADSQYSVQLERVPETFRPAGNDLGAEVDCAVSRLQQRRRVLDEREVERVRRRNQIDGLVTRYETLEHSRRTQVDEPADHLWNTVVAHRSALDRVSEDLVASVSLPAIESRPVVSDLAAFVQLTTRVTEKLIAVGQASAQEAQASSGAAKLVLGRLAADFDLDPDDPSKVVAAAAGLTEDAAVDRRKVQADAESFRRRMPAIVALRAAGAALDERYLVLSDLSAALRDGAFPKWLTLRRSRSLLVHASRLLSEITVGRYAFADLDDEDSQWCIFDSDNGQARSPASLSGGEKFVASLALALGMVEMMGRQGGRIESLFLDEGFGALDRTNLDAAVEALASVAATGRLVAVITHIRAVAEQIDHVLSVTREPTGTQTEWLSPSARSTLAEGDLSAPGGLLE